MIITISGKPGSGKDTIGDLLGKEVELKVIKATLKKNARRKGINILEFEKKYAMKSNKYDLELDEWQKKHVKAKCILVSMLSAYNIPDANLKVWLHCPLKERARRISKRDNILLSKAMKYVKERDKVFKTRISKLYGVDFGNQRFYDINIDTSKNNPKQIIGIILKRLKEVS